MNSVRGSPLPRLLMRPRIVRSPVDICFGTKPSQAAKSRPFGKGSAVADGRYHGAGDERADARNGHQLAATLAAMRQKLIYSVTCSIRSSRRRQSPLRSSIVLIIRGDNTSLRLARMSGSCWRRKRSP